MKKTIAIFVAVLFLFAMASFSLATEEKKAAPAPAPAEKKMEPAAEKPKVKQVTGDVKAVDMKAMTITVTKMMKGKAEDTVATVSDKTKIMMGEAKKALADVKVGDKVTVKYTEAEGKNMAKSVAIHEPEKKAEPAAKPAEKK
jgi:ribosomal protein S1